MFVVVVICIPLLPRQELTNAVCCCCCSTIYLPALALLGVVAPLCAPKCTHTQTTCNTHATQLHSSSHEISHNTTTMWRPANRCDVYLNISMSVCVALYMCVILVVRAFLFANSCRHFKLFLFCFVHFFLPLYVPLLACGTISYLQQLLHLLGGMLICVRICVNEDMFPAGMANEA